MSSLDKLPLIPEDEARAWSHWPTHPLRIAWHNRTVEAIQKDRSELETCSSTEVLEIQTRIRIRREFLAWVHRKDPEPKPK